MGTNVAFNEYVAEANEAHSDRLFEIIPTFEYSPTPGIMKYVYGHFWLTICFSKNEAK